LKDRGLSGLSQYLEDNGIDNLTVPVNVFREYLTLLESGEPPPKIYSLRVAGVIYGRDLRRARGLLRADTQITNGYSISEAFLVAQNAWTSSDVLPGDDEIVLVGRPLATEAIELRDDDGRAVAIGETGRIYLRGRALAQGYYGDEATTAARFRTIEETGLREYDTGDIGSIGVDGHLRVHGRADGVVKVRGVRIGLDEVDGALTGLPEVQHAVAYVVQADDEEELGATLTLRAGADLDMQRLREALLPVLAEAKIPSDVRVATQLPRTHTGKVDRRAAQAEAPNLPRLAARTKNAAAPPKDEIERQLAQIWKDVLGRRVEDRHADFFALGGHSLKAMRLVAQVEKRMNVALTMADIAQGPSLLEQAVLVNERMRRGPAESASRPSLVTFAEQGVGAPICVVPPSNGTAIEQMPLAKALGSERTVHVLQPLGWSSHERPIASADVLADAYLQTVRTVITDAGVVLIGVCSGSRYALMMAQWLQAHGTEPELVVLLDPSVARERARPRHEMTIGDHLSYGFELLRYRQYGRLKTYFLGGLKRNALRLVSERHRRMHEMHVATSRAAWCSRVSPYSGRTLIVTSEETERLSAERKKWTTMCSGRCEVARISGTTHRDIVIGTAAEKVAAEIELALAAQQGRCTES
jgi:thioesterase domain-containing protein/acyl carrier protein